MRKLIITQGIPGSGKSTWALNYVKENPNTVRINNDDLRMMMFGRQYDKRDTKTISDFREKMIEFAISKGKDIIVDNTNLHDVALPRYEGLAKEHGYELIIKDFRFVDLGECLHRDMMRERPVGPEVVKSFWSKFVMDKSHHDNYDKQLNKDLEDCILVDLDGTLARMINRKPYEWDRVFEDALNRRVADLTNVLYSLNYKVFIMSGRDAVCRAQTEHWLAQHHVSYDALYMRQEKDSRKDSIVKRELFEAHVRGQYNVVAVFDDRPQVCRMWFNLGLPLFKVGHPDHEF